MQKIKNLIKNVLSIPYVRNCFILFNQIFYGTLSLNRFLGTIFLLFVPFSFNRERFALIKGKARYYKSLNKSGKNNALLRRNIHRLEKALIMEPRRAKFALNYIGETIDLYEAALKGDKNCLRVEEEEILWSRDVLTRYFESIELDNHTSHLQERFFKANIGFFNSSPISRVPYMRSESAQHNVSFEDLLQLSKRRRSVRWFKDTQVPREVIDKALLIAIQSPSACNRQPFEYRIFDSPELVQKIVKIPMGTKGFGHNIQTIAVIVGKQDYFFSSRDRHLIYIDASLSAMAFILGLETLGVSSCVLNWPDIEILERKMQKILNLEYHERVIMLLAIGFAREDGGIPFSQKKSLNNIRNYNKI